MKDVKFIMRLNAFSCILFGLVFLLLPRQASEFVSGLGSHTVFFTTVGIGLFFNGMHLIFSAARGPKKLELLYFSIGDFLWVAATVVGIGLRYVVTTASGIVVALMVAMMVGMFGYKQAKSMISASPRTRRNIDR